MKISAIARPTVALSIAAASLFATTGRANAAAPPLQEACVKDALTYSCVDFYIYWSHRTARVTGTIYLGPNDRATHVSFATYVGSTETNRRTINATTAEIPKGFNMTVGNANVRGDLTQIKVWVCADASGSGTLCGPIYPFSRS